MSDLEGRVFAFEWRVPHDSPVGAGAGASRSRRRAADNRTMTPDPIIGRVLFVDGIVRPVFRDDAGHQYVIDADGDTRCYGAWLRPEDAEADAPLVLREPRDPR